MKVCDNDKKDIQILLTIIVKKYNWNENNYYSKN